MIMAFLLGPFVSGVAAAGQPQKSFSNGQANITTDQATISVNGNANTPFYRIKLNNSSTTYEVKFMSVQEWVNNKAVPSSGISMPSVGWTFSNFNTVNDSSNNIQSINFNFTSTASVKKNEPSIQLDNHVNVANGNQIKFDLIINNYAWTSKNTSAQLAVKFQIAGGNISQGTNKNDLSFGDAHFNSVSTASTPGGNVNVNTQVESGNSFYLVFDHFNGNFSLDPTFSAVAGSSTGNTTSGVSLSLLPIIGGLAVVGIVYTAKKRNA